MSSEGSIAGIVNHLGWAIVVCAAKRAGVIEVIDRRRIELLDPDLPNAPYEHHVARLTPPEAEALIARVKASAAEHAYAALGELAVEAIAIREGPSPAIPAAVAEVLVSRAATFAADGELFRRALCDAALALGLEVALQPRKPDLARVSVVLGADGEEFLRATGKALGPPWRRDHRDAAACAIAALGPQGLRRAREVTG